MMHRLFWGLFFVLLDLNITVGRATFEILPDFAGFFLLMKGMEELSDSIPRFEKSRHGAFGAFLVSTIVYGAGLLNQEAMTGVWLWVLELGCLAIFLWLLRQITRDMSAEIKGLPMIVAVVQILSHVLGWVPLIGSVCTVASTVVSAVFLLCFWKEMKKGAA